MKRLLIPPLLFLSIISGVFFLVPAGKAPSEENPYKVLYRLMELSGATIVEGEVHYWASLESLPEISEHHQLEKIADDLLKRLVLFAEGSPRGLKPLALPLHMMAERCVSLPCGGQIRLLLMGMEQEGKEVLHLFITVNQKGEGNKIAGLAKNLPSLLGAEVQKEELTFSLVGHLDKELSLTEMKELSRLIISSIGGEQVQSISDGKILSVTAYTPSLESFIKAESLKINLNIALRYDDYLDKTVILAGTPLISRYY